MLKYIIKRLLWMIPVILGVLIIVFILSEITPGVRSVDALVRLADEIDVTSARNSPLLYDIGAITDLAERAEHLRHRAVHGLEIDPEAFLLRIDDTDPVVTGSIRRMAAKMQATLDECRAAVNGRTGFVITQREVRVLPDRQGAVGHAATK